MKMTKKLVRLENYINSLYNDETQDLMLYGQPFKTRIKDGLLYRATGYMKEFDTPENIRGLRATDYVDFDRQLEKRYLTKNIQEVYPLSLHGHLYLLESIKVDPENDSYCDIDGVLFTKDKKKLVAFPEGRLGDVYTVPEGTEIIGENAFMHAFVTEVVMPSTLKKIEPDAFLEANIYICDFSNTTHNRLGARCFKDCCPTYVIRNGKMVLEDVYTQQGNWGYKSCFFITPDKKDEIYEKIFIEE